MADFSLTSDVLTLISSVELVVGAGLAYACVATTSSAHFSSSSISSYPALDGILERSGSRLIGEEEAGGIENSRAPWWQLGMPIITNRKPRSLKGQKVRKLK